MALAYADVSISFAGGSEVAKPGKAIAKTTIKTSFELYEKGKDAAAEAVEVWQDLVAGVQAELAAEKQIDSSDRTSNSSLP
ncbi:MAG: DUF5132 domain-containing protein [Phormidium sp.]